MRWTIASRTYPLLGVVSGAGGSGGAGHRARVCTWNETSGRIGPGNLQMLKQPEMAQPLTDNDVAVPGRHLDRVHDRQSQD